MLRLRSLIREIHRRSIWQVLAVYLAGAWVGYTAIEALVSGLGLPNWFPAFAVILFIIGLPLVLATAVVQEGGPRATAMDPTLLPGSEAADQRAATTSPETPAGTQRFFTWRNAVMGGVFAFALWGLVAAGWLMLRGGAPREAAPTVATAEAPQRKKVAVLPLENLGAAEDEYFADGLTEEIISRLAEIADLGVISRTSAMQYKGTGKSIKEIGEELDVQYILEGTVRWEHPRDGTSRVRVTPQLIRVADDTHLWAQRYDAVLAGVFEIQSDIAQRVADAMGIALVEPRRWRSEERPTDDLEAYESYLRGNDHLYRGFSQPSIEKAVELFQRAVALDPNFAVAYAKLGQAHGLMFWFFYDRSETRLEAAKRAIDRALQLRPDLPEAHLALGSYYYRHRDYEGALEEYAVLARQRPGSGEAAYALGSAYRRKGDWRLAADSYRKSAEFDPRSAENAHTTGSTLLYMRNYSEARSYLDRSISLQPDWAQPRLYKAWLRLATGDKKRALAQLQAAIERIAPSPLVVAVDDVQPWYMLRSLASEELQMVSRLSFSFFGIDTASYYLTRAEIHELSDEHDLARAYYDSVRVMMEGRIAARPAEAHSHSLLGVAYAGLGRKSEAMAEARKATELLPVSADALWGRTFRENLAWVYVQVDEYDEAIDELEFLLSVPGLLSPALLRIDPAWEPLRHDSRFQELMADG